jgi:predicted nucleotidyltransferase
MSESLFPTKVAALASQLADLPGVVAVALGGSRATGTHRPDSDWDLGLYYRASRPFDPDDLRGIGHGGYVSELGEWGPIMNGGAWLTIDGMPIDVLFRDLDAIEGRIEEAQRGRFEVLAQNGYVVGAPTYVPVGELAVCQPIVGDLPRPGFPDALAATAPERWRGRASVALMFARLHAATPDTVACAGMLAEAALCAAHARLAERREWALNEKRLIHRAGFDTVQPFLAEPGSTATELGDTVTAVSTALGVEPLSAR